MVQKWVRSIKNGVLVNVEEFRPWIVTNISFDGSKFWMTHVVVKPPNHGEIAGLAESNEECSCFTTCSGELVGISETRALWQMNYNGNCSLPKHSNRHRYLIEQDFLT